MPLLPLDLLSPSSNLSNGLFVSLRVSSYGIHPLFQPSSSLLKDIRSSNGRKIARKTKSCEKSKQSGANHDHHGCDCHHGQTVAATMAHGDSHSHALVASGHPTPLVFKRYVLCFFLSLQVLPWIFRLGPLLQPLLTLYDLNFSTFS